MGVGDTGNVRKPTPQLMRHAQVGRAIATDDPKIDLRRQAEIEDLGDHVGRLKIEGDRWEGSWQYLAQPAHVVGGRRVPFFERYQDHPVIDIDRRAVAEGEVIALLRHADVVDDELPVALRNDLSD